MPTLQAINIAPVKSLGLLQPRSVTVGQSGVAEDRLFCVVDEQGRMVTQRQIGEMVQVRAEYRREPALRGIEGAESLRLVFPDGSVVEGAPRLRERDETKVWGRLVPGRVVDGDWSAALSDFCGKPLRLVRADAAPHYLDEFPVSLLSGASVDELARRSDGSVAFDARRFRPTLLITGAKPHEEDTWLGRTVRIGASLRLRVVARDPRCAITTHDPDTGERDVDTLGLILSYRPDPKAAYFGVYATVEQPGAVSVGDKVTPE